MNIGYEGHGAFRSQTAETGRGILVGDREAHGVAAHSIKGIEGRERRNPGRIRWAGKSRQGVFPHCLDGYGPLPSHHETACLDYPGWRSLHVIVALDGPEHESEYKKSNSLA